MDILDSMLGSFELDPPTADDRHWSPFQLAVFDAAKNPSNNLLIQAVAGSGKTTTIVKAMSYAPGTSLLMAFNKAIAVELQSRITPGMDAVVKTLNGLGHGLMMRHRRSATLNAKKVSEILRRIMGEGSPDLKDYGFTLDRVVGLMKNCAFGLLAPEKLIEVDEVAQLIDAYQMDIPFERVHELSARAIQAFYLSLEDKSTFDFNDQLYIPLMEDWSFPYFSNVFVDEAQDLSPIQHLMLQRLATAGSRIIAVGDTYQSIYGFRGALSGSMEVLKRRFNMVELPLSISYRCPIMVVEEARNYCPHIEPKPSALLGTVDFAEDSGGEPALFSNVLVVCRNNAPLFRAILRHVRAKSPCRVLTNFLDSFQGFLRSFKCRTTIELQTKLETWFEREKEAAERKGFKGKVAGLLDKYETTKLLCKEFQLVQEVLDCIQLLGQGTTGPIFATIHKAKGLEHENVYLLRPDILPSPFATTPEAMQQEANLAYVAITRAKNKLTYGIAPKGY